MQIFFYLYDDKFLVLKFSFLWKKNFMVLFYGWNSTASRLEPLQRCRLLFTIKFPEMAGTHFVNLRRMSNTNTEIRSKERMGPYVAKMLFLFSR